jgi:hypothetical protein
MHAGKSEQARDILKKAMRNYPLDNKLNLVLNRLIEDKIKKNMEE